MTTNAVVLGSCVFILLLTSILFTMYNVNCPSMARYTNETYNESELKVEWQDVIWNSKCEGLPDWYQWVIYGPLLIIGGKSALTMA